MNSSAIDSFVQKNLRNFRTNGSGWNDLIAKMLFECCLAGWDLNTPIGGKEKFGGLRCYVTVEDKALEARIQKIISTYMALSGKTCEHCGNPGKERIDKVTQWVQTLCSGCYITDVMKRPPRFSPVIPPDMFSECSICGYMAVAAEACHFCSNVDYASVSHVFKPSAFYSSAEEYIKERQIEVFLDEDDAMKLSRLTKHFKKSTTHQLLFSTADLERYLAEQSEE